MRNLPKATISCVQAGFPHSGGTEVAAIYVSCDLSPKQKAAQVLHELEAGPRDVYCGAIGWCDPAGPMRFSVAIRTISLFNEGRAVFNVGGGIVFDSKAEAEYEECLLKARFAVGDEWISR